jgi:hypothetical protein
MPSRPNGFSRRQCEGGRRDAARAAFGAEDDGSGGRGVCRKTKTKTKRKPKNNREREADDGAAVVPSAAESPERERSRSPLAARRSRAAARGFAREFFDGGDRRRERRRDGATASRTRFAFRAAKG